MKKGLRVVATITLVCFLTTQSVWGAPTAGIEIANGRELPTYLSIDVPSELGTVDALYEAPGAAHPQFILHIQNAHANYDAQVKIKQLLEHMNKKYGFKTIFVEGASEKMDADYLRLFPDQKRNMELCDALAKKGELTGAELYLMEQGQGLGTRDLGLEKTRNRNESRGTSDVSRAEDRQVEALGIENVSLYRSNYDALKKVFGAEADVNRFFSGFDSKLDRVASKTFTPEARQLIADWKRFEQGRREFMPFVRELAKRAKKTLDLDLESLFAQVGWPQISRLLAIQQLEKDLDKEKGLAEKEALIKALRKKHVSKELLATLTSFNEGSIAVGKSSAEVSPREILERLNSEAGPQGFKFSDYPAFSLFAGYVTLRSELDAKVLFEEIEYLFTQMLDAMAQDPQQKSLLSLYRDGELLRKLLHLELNRAQWRELLQNRDRMTVEALVTRLKDAVIASGDASVAKNKDVMSKDFNGKMSEIFDAGLSFYNYARQREDVFYQEMKSAMAERKITKAVLITGGFHTDGMSDMFRQNAVSYGIVTPRLSERSNEGLYRSMMMGKHSDAFDVSYLEATVKMQNPQIQFDQQGRYDATAIFAEFMKKINETDPAKVLAAYKAQTPAYQKLLASGLDVVISDGRITLIRAVFGPKAIVTAFQEAVEVSRGSSKHEDLARVTNDAFTAYSDAGAASETVEELRRHFENSSLGEEARSIFLAQLSRSESRGLTAVVKALALGAAISPFGLKAEMPATTEEPAAPAANTAPAIQPVIRGEKGVFTISDIRVTLPVAGVAAAAQGVTTSVTNAATPVFTSILQDAGDTVLGIVVAAEKAALSGFHFEIRGTADLKDWASILEFDYDGAMPKGATVAFGLRIPERLETKFRAVATGRSESREMVNLVVSMAAVGYLALGCATTNVPKSTAEASVPQAVSTRVDTHEAVRALDGKREMIMKDLANSETPVATLVNDLNLILGAQKATTKSNNARMRIAGFRKMVQEAWDGGRLQDPQVKPLAEEIMSITRSESRGHTGLKDPYWGSEHFVFTHRKDGPVPQPGPGDVFRVDLRGGSGTRTIAFKTDAGLEAFRGLEIDADTVKSDIDSLLENAEFNKSRIDRALKRSETLSILLMGWDPEVSSEILPVQDEALGQAIELLLKNSVGVNAERAFPKWRELALADLAARPDLNGTDIKAALTSAARQAELSATGEMVQDVLERVAAATEPVLRAENAVMDAEALRSYFVDDNKQFYAPAWDAFVGAFRARSESRTLLDAYASPEDFMDYLKNVALPHFFNAYPEARNKYQEYRTAFNAGDKVIAKALAKEIDALVTQYNRAINHVGTYASRIQNFDYKTLVQADVAPVADAYSAEETLKGEDLVLEGAEVLEFFAAGAATRLGLGNMFLLSPRKFLKVFEMLPRVRAKDPSGLDAASMKIYTRLAGREDKDLAALEAVAEVSIASLRAMLENNPEFFDLPMGARVLLNRRASVEALVRKRYAGMDESLIQHQIEKSLARQQVSILLNEDVAQEAIAYLHSRDFFGFDRKNIYITVQPTFKGLAPADDVSKTIREVTDSELVNGHGHPSMQKFFAGQAFTVAENGEPQYLTVPLVDSLYTNGGKILSITRINDIIQYDFDSPQTQGNALDIPVLIAKVKEMGGFIALDDPEQGADEVFELLDNPAKAKGGIFPATPALKAQGFGIMPDTLAFDANRDKVTGVPADPDANGAVERIETAIGGGMPYNRMSQSYKLASLSAARKNGRLKGIPVYLRFREFDSGKPLAFAGETVTGDMAYFLNARAVRQPNRKINDFKEAKNTPTLLQVFAKEDALFKQLGYERYARSESRKAIVEAAMAVGVAGMLGLIGLVSTNYHMRIAERMARSREAMRGLSVSEGPVTLGRLAEKVRVPVAILKDQNYDSVLYYYYRDEMDAKKFLESFEGFLSPESAEDLNRLQAIVAIAETLRIQAVERAQLIAQGKDLSKSDAVIVDLLLALENSATREYRNTVAREAFNQATTEAVGMLRAGASKQAALELALNAYDRYARSETRVTDEDQREAIKLVRSVVESLTQNNGMGGVEGRRQFANLGTLWVAQILMSTIVPQLDRTLQSLVDEIGDWPEISDADRSRAADSIKAMQATFAPRMEAYRSEITPEMLAARSESREVLFKVGDETFSVEIPKTLHARSHTFMVPRETPDLSFILKQGELSQMDASITAEYHIYIGNIDDEHIEDAKKQTPVESVPVKFVELYPQQSVGSDVIALGIEIAPDFVAALSKPDFLKDAAPGVKQLLAAWAHRLERQPVAVFANKVKTPKAKKSATPVRSESRIELTKELKVKLVDALNQGIKDPALMVTLAMLDAKKLGKIVVPFKPEEDVAVYGRMLTAAQLAAVNKAVLDAINVTRAQGKQEPVKNPLILEPLPVANALWTIASLAGIASARSESRVTQEEKNDVITFIQTHMPALVVDYSGKPGDMKAAQTLGLMGSAFWTVLVPTDEKLGTGGIHSGASDERFSPFKTLFDEGFSGSETKGIRGALSLRQVIDRAQTSAELQAILVAAAAAQALASSAPGSAIRKAINAPELWSEPDLFTAMRDAILKTATWYAFESAKNSLPEQSEAIPTRKVWHFVTGIGTVADPGVVFDGVLFARNIGANDQDVTIAWDDLGTLRYDLITKVATIQEMKFKEPVTAQEAYAAFYARSESRKGDELVTSQAKAGVISGLRSAGELIAAIAYIAGIAALAVVLVPVSKLTYRLFPGLEPEAARTLAVAKQLGMYLSLIIAPNVAVGVGFFVGAWHWGLGAFVGVAAVGGIVAALPYVLLRESAPAAAANEPVSQPSVPQGLETTARSESRTEPLAEVVFDGDALKFYKDLDAAMEKAIKSLGGEQRVQEFYHLGLGSWRKTIPSAKAGFNSRYKNTGTEDDFFYFKDYLKNVSEKAAEVLFDRNTDGYLIGHHNYYHRFGFRKSPSGKIQFFYPTGIWRDQKRHSGWTDLEATGVKMVLMPATVSGDAWGKKKDPATGRMVPAIVSRKFMGISLRLVFTGANGEILSRYAADSEGVGFVDLDMSQIPCWVSLASKRSESRGELTAEKIRQLSPILGITPEVFNTVLGYSFDQIKAAAKDERLGKTVSAKEIEAIEKVMGSKTGLMAGNTVASVVWVLKPLTAPTARSESREFVDLAKNAFEKGLIKESAYKNIQSWAGDEFAMAHADLNQEFAAAGDDAAKWSKIEDSWFQIVAPGTAGMRGTMGWGTNRINVFTVGQLMLAHARAVQDPVYTQMIEQNYPGFLEKNLNRAMVKDITLPNYFYHEIVLNNGEMVIFFDNVTLDGAPGKKRVVSLLGTAVRSNGESEGVTLKRKGMSETYTPATWESTVKGVPVEISLQSSKANTNQVVLRVKAAANIPVRVRKRMRSESRGELTAEKIGQLSPILGITPEEFQMALGYSFDQIKAAAKDERLGKTVSAKEIEAIKKVMGSKTGLMAGNTVASVVWVLKPLTVATSRSESRDGVVAEAKWVSISPKVLAMPRAFGTNGIRGTGFNVDEIRRMTASTAIELKAEWERTQPGQPLPTLGVAVDPRPQGPEGFSMDFEKQMVYARAKAEVLAAYGFPVRFYAKPVGSGHMIATTSPSYPAAQQNYATLMGTASHNEVVDPKTGELQFGFKVFKGNAPIMDDFAAGISNHLNGNEDLEIPQLQEVPILDFDEAVKQGRIEIVADPAAFEFERLNELYDFAALGRAFREKFPKKRIALNTMNGGASGLAPKILKAMGFTDENSRAFNTTFMNDPSMKKTVMEFVEGPGGKQVRFAPDPTRAWFRGKDYDAYMAQDLANTIAMLIDGDADRLVLEDLGEISPNQIGPMIKFYLNRYLKDQNPNYVDARTVPTTSAMDLLNKALGVAAPKVTDVGSKNFVPFLGDLQVGLEESGHIAFRYKGQVFFDHPVALMLLMMKMMADTGKTWRELEDEMWAFIQEKTGAPRIETSRTGIGKDEGAEAYYPLLAKLPKDAALRQSFGEAIAAEFKAQGLNVSLEGFDTNAPGGVQFHLSSFVRTMPRKSGTDGSVRFYFESPSDQVATLKKIGTPVMKKVLDQFLARSESRGEEAVVEIAETPYERSRQLSAYLNANASVPALVGFLKGVPANEQASYLDTIRNSLQSRFGSVLPWSKLNRFESVWAAPRSESRTFSDEMVFSIEGLGDIARATNKVLNVEQIESRVAVSAAAQKELSDALAGIPTGSDEPFMLALLYLCSKIAEINKDLSDRTEKDWTRTLVSRCWFALEPLQERIAILMAAVSFKAPAVYPLMEILSTIESNEANSDELRRAAFAARAAALPQTDLGRRFAARSESRGKLKTLVAIAMVAGSAAAVSAQVVVDVIDFVYTNGVAAVRFMMAPDTNLPVYVRSVFAQKAVTLAGPYTTASESVIPSEGIVLDPSSALLLRATVPSAKTTEFFRIATEGAEVIKPLKMVSVSTTNMNGQAGVSNNIPAAAQPVNRSESRMDDLRQIAKSAIQKAYAAVMSRDLATRGLNAIYKQRKEIRFALMLTDAVAALSAYDAPESLTGVIEGFKNQIAGLKPTSGWKDPVDLEAFTQAVAVLDGAIESIRSESRTPTKQLKPISPTFDQQKMPEHMLSWRQALRQQELANPQRPIRMIAKAATALDILAWGVWAVIRVSAGAVAAVAFLHTAVFGLAIAGAMIALAALSTFAERMIRSAEQYRQEHPRQNVVKRPPLSFAAAQTAPVLQLPDAERRERMDAILAKAEMGQRLKDPAMQEASRQELDALLGAPMGRSESRELGAKALQQIQSMDQRIRQLIADNATMDEIVALEEKRAAMVDQLLGIKTPKKTSTIPAVETQTNIDGLNGEIALVDADLPALQAAYDQQAKLLESMAPGAEGRAQASKELLQRGRMLDRALDSKRKLGMTLETQMRSESRDQFEGANDNVWTIFRTYRFGRKAPNGEFYLGMDKTSTHPGQAIIDMIDAILLQKEGMSLVEKGFTVDDADPKLAQDLFDIAAMFIDVASHPGASAEPVVTRRTDGRFYAAEGYQNPFVLYLNALRDKIDLQLRLDKALEAGENKVRERQQFAEELIQELTPVEIAMLREGRTGFSPASILQVFCGIVVAVDATRPNAHEAALVGLRAYLVELRSGEFSFDRYIQNVGRLVAHYKVFEVSDASGVLIRDVQTMPSSSWFSNLALQLATNVNQRVQIVVNKAIISEDNCGAIDANLSQIRKMASADGKGIRERLAVSFEMDVIGEMVEQAQHLGKASEGLYPVLYTETESVREALVARADSLFGTVVFGENKTATDNALAPMRDAAAMKLSQQKRSGQINTQDDLNTILAELLKELPNVFKFAGKDQVTLENSALAGLAHVLQQLISAAATAKSA